MSPPALGSVVLVSGDGQTGTPGLMLPDTLRARVLSTTGAPMSGVSVTWTVTYGGGTLSDPTHPSGMDTATHADTYTGTALATLADTSDVNGDVAVALRLGAAPGATHVVAEASNLPGVTFTATARGLQATQVTMGFERACAIDVQGRTWCWGVYPGDSTSRARSYMPSLVVGSHHFIEVAAADEHTCGLEASGSVWCWGLALYGNLGTGAVEQQIYNYPIPLANAPPFSHIFGSDEWITCGLTPDGSAYCWGHNAAGEVGSGDSAGTVPIPEAVAGGHKFKSISIGDTHACGIALDGTAWCWGTGSLGTGAVDTTSSVPVAVQGGYQFRSITAAQYFTCGVTLSAGAVCWGRVPDGDDPRGTPTAEPALNRYAEFTAGGGMSAAVGGPEAFSLPSFGNTLDAQSPVYLHGISGGFWAACALAQDATVYCWGANTGGELGNSESFGYDFGWAPVHAVVVPANY